MRKGITREYYRSLMTFSFDDDENNEIRSLFQEGLFSLDDL